MKTFRYCWSLSLYLLILSIFVFVGCNKETELTTLEQQSQQLEELQKRADKLLVELKLQTAFLKGFNSGYVIGYNRGFVQGRFTNEPRIDFDKIKAQEKEVEKKLKNKYE